MLISHPSVQSVHDTVLHIAFRAAWAPLGCVNAWALRDNGGWAIVDTGFSDAATRQQWDEIIDTVLDGPVTRIICTHFHPDHIGQAGYLAQRTGAPLHMSAVEWQRARSMVQVGETSQQSQFERHLKSSGLPEDVVEALASRRSNPLTPGFPDTFISIADGQELKIGNTVWTAQLAGGHSPAPVILSSAEQGLVIVGDQILPRITPHVGTSANSAEADPLGDYLQFLAAAAHWPASWLALPGHGDPFTDAGHRATAIAAHHREQLDDLFAALNTPRRCIDVIDVLFRRKLEGMALIMGLTEAHAHLQHLVKIGKASQSQDVDGTLIFSAHRQPTR